MKKRLNNKLFMNLLLIFFLIALIISGVKIITYLSNNYSNKKIKENINKKVKISYKKGLEYNVDFESLKGQNPDTVAYLKVNGTNIDYIVVQGNDNDYYLKHNYNKNKNVSGWIFADYHNRFDDTDKNIIIYGHNTRDGSMFGTLKNVLTNNWQQTDNNLIITLVTEKDTYYYKVFSTYEIIPEDYYLKTEFKDTNEFDRFINKIKDRSNYNYNIEVNSSDKILTLSSCTIGGKTRVVLHAKKIIK